MMYSIEIAPEADKVLAKWKKSNPQMFKKFRKIYHELMDHPRTGTGHPEALRLKREFPRLQAGDESAIRQISGSLCISLLYLPICVLQTRQNRSVSIVTVADSGALEIPLLA